MYVYNNFLQLKRFLGADDLALVLLRQRYKFIMFKWGHRFSGIGIVRFIAELTLEFIDYIYHICGWHALALHVTGKVIVTSI